MSGAYNNDATVFFALQVSLSLQMSSAKALLSPWTMPGPGKHTEPWAAMRNVYVAYGMLHSCEKAGACHVIVT